MIAIDETVMSMDGDGHHQPVAFTRRFAEGDLRDAVVEGKAARMRQTRKAQPGQRRKMNDVFAAVGRLQARCLLYALNFDLGSLYKIIKIGKVVYVRKSKSAISPVDSRGGVHHVVEEHLLPVDAVPESFHGIGSGQGFVQVILKKRDSLRLTLLISSRDVHLYAHAKKGFFELFEEMEDVFALPGAYVDWFFHANTWIFLMEGLAVNAKLTVIGATTEAHP